MKRLFPLLVASGIAYSSLTMGAMPAPKVTQISGGDQTVTFTSPTSEFLSRSDQRANVRLDIDLKTGDVVQKVSGTVLDSSSFSLSIGRIGTGDETGESYDLTPLVKADGSILVAVYYSGKSLQIPHPLETDKTNHYNNRALRLIAKLKSGESRVIASREFGSYEDFSLTLKATVTP
jgi:hypothetical protein